VSISISVNYCKEKYRKDLKKFRPKSVFSMKELAYIVSNWPWSPSIFKDNHRNNENVLETNLIVLDYDNGSMRLDAMIITLEVEELRYMIGISQNHQKEKHGLIADRFRVILFPENKPALNNDIQHGQYKDQLRYFHEKYPKPDDSCMDPSRFYSPSQIVAVGDGSLVSWPEANPIDQYENKQLLITKSQIRDKRIGRLSYKIDLFLNEGIIYGESRRKCCYMTARKLGKIGWSFENTFAAIINAPFNKENFSKADLDDLPRQIKNGWLAGRAIFERQSNTNK